MKRMFLDHFFPIFLEIFGKKKEEIFVMICRVFFPVFSSMTVVYEANIHYTNSLLPSDSECFKTPSVQNLEVTRPLNLGLKILSKPK